MAMHAERCTHTGGGVCCWEWVGRGLERKSTLCWIAASYVLFKRWLRQVQMVEAAILDCSLDEPTQNYRQCPCPRAKTTLVAHNANDPCFEETLYAVIAMSRCTMQAGISMVVQLSCLKWGFPPPSRTKDGFFTA